MSKPGSSVCVGRTDAVLGGLPGTLSHVVCCSLLACLKLSACEQAQAPWKQLEREALECGERVTQESPVKLMCHAPLQEECHREPQLLGGGQPSRPVHPRIPNLWGT